MTIVPNWHPVLVHFTIALLAIATVLFIVVAVAGRSRPLPGVEAAANWNLWLGAIITAATLAAGLQAAGSVVHDEPAHLAMQEHKFWAFGTAALFMLLALWNAARVRRGAAVGVLFPILLAVAAAGLVGTGLRGADLVFGHGLGVMALPEPGGAGHTHDHDEAGGAGHAPDEDDAEVAADALPAAEAGVVAVLVAYHDALTSGDAAAPEPFVLTDGRFTMVEGKHVNRGWADYRDNHLRDELADLAKVRFRLSAYQVQMSGDVAAVSFLFNILPKTGPEMDFGSGRATAILLRTGGGWKLQHLHTS